MSPLLNSPINRSADQSSLSAWNKNQKGGRCLPFNLTHFTAAHQYFSTTVRKVNSTRVSISARPSSNIVNILPPAPGLRAVPSQAAAIARPSPSAPPKAAIPTANEPIAGKNHEPPVLFAAAVAAGDWAIAVATVNSITSAVSTNSFNLIIVFSPEARRTSTPIHFHRRIKASFQFSAKLQFVAESFLRALDPRQTEVCRTPCE